MMVKGLIARFKYRLKATRCSLQAPGKIIDIKQDEHYLYIMTIQYYAESKFIERKPFITYFQMKYFKNNKRVTVDYDPNSPDTFIIEEDYLLYDSLIFLYLVVLYWCVVLHYLSFEVNYEENNNNTSWCTFNSLYTIFNN